MESKHGIKVIETGKILPSIHYKKHHLQVSFVPRLNAFRVYLVWDDTNKPHKNRIEALCPYNMSKTAAKHFIRHLYWYQTNIADALKYHEYAAALREELEELDD